VAPPPQAAIAPQQFDPATGAPMESTEPQVAPPPQAPVGNPALAKLSIEELQAIAFGAK
jgi:hypothetical protein